jgi:RNA-directed DNA polymerase
LCKDRNLLQGDIRQTVEGFLAERGLKLSEEKTCISSLEQGFNFLGFHIRCEKNHVVVSPAQKNQQNILSKIEMAVFEDHGTNTAFLTDKINALLRGWSNYYQYCQAKSVFREIDGAVSVYLQKAAQKIGVLRIGKRKRNRYLRIQDGCNHYSFEWQHYLEERNTAAVLRRRARHSVLYRTWVKQSGYCPVCMMRITRETDFSIHGGYVRHGEHAGEFIQQLLHMECHERVHRNFPDFLYDSNSFTAR